MQPPSPWQPPEPGLQAPNEDFFDMPYNLSKAPLTFKNFLGSRMSRAEAGKVWRIH